MILLPTMYGTCTVKHMRLHYGTDGDRSVSGNMPTLGLLYVAGNHNKGCGRKDNSYGGSDDSCGSTEAALVAVTTAVVAVTTAVVAVKQLW